MLVPHAIKRLARRHAGERGLTETEALELFSAVLDGGSAEFELGALLGALATRPLAPSELAGFSRATQARLNRLEIGRAHV